MQAKPTGTPVFQIALHIGRSGLKRIEGSPVTGEFGPDPARLQGNLHTDIVAGARQAHTSKFHLYMQNAAEIEPYLPPRRLKTRLCGSFRLGFLRCLVSEGRQTFFCTLMGVHHTRDKSLCKATVKARHVLNMRDTDRDRII